MDHLLPPPKWPNTCKIKIDQIGDYLKMHGMRVDKVTFLPGADTMLWLVPKDHEGQAAPPESKLSKTLRGMLERCLTQPGRAERASLGHGLRIDMMVDLEGVCRLQISREGTFPSEKEWETVIKHWPGTLPFVSTDRIEYNSRCYIRGRWVIDPALDVAENGTPPP